MRFLIWGDFPYYIHGPNLITGVVIRKGRRGGVRGEHVTREAEGQIRERFSVQLPALKMEEGAVGRRVQVASRSWEKARKWVLPYSLRRRHIIATTLILVQ